MGLLWAAGCDLSSKPDRKDGGPGGGDDPPEVTSSLSLGAQGGVVAMADSSSEVFGANLVVPPDALGRFTEITLQVAESIPEGSNAFGAGPAVEVLPEELSFDSPATLELPVPDGLDPEGLTAGRWDPDAQSWVLAPGETRFDDPQTERGGNVAIPVTGGGTFRLLYMDPQPVEVLNDGSGAIDVRLATQHFQTREGRGYTPPPPRSGFERALEPRAVATLLLVPGDYVVQATFEGESVPRCERVTVTDPVSSTEPLAVAFSDFTPPCPLPAVRSTATPREVSSNEPVRLQAVATASAGGSLTWHWLVTGGSIEGETTGTTTSGEAVDATWLAPDAPGFYYLSFVAIGEEEWFAEAHTSVEVTTRNQRPRIQSLLASPATVGPGFPDGARAVAEPGNPGVTRLRTVVSDLDGDAVAVYWLHRQPGHWYDVESGARLAADEASGLVVWPEDGAPYTASQVLYMAPPSLYVEALSRGWWMPATITASDGELRDRAWRMVSVAREAEPPPADAGSVDGGRMDAGPPPRDAGRDGGPDASGPAVAGRCLSVLDSRCEMYVGSFYRGEEESLEASCTSMGWTWTVGFACPESGAIGACFRFPGEEREVATVYYGAAPTTEQIDTLRDECRALPVAEGGPGTWMRPYRAPR